MSEPQFAPVTWYFSGKVHPSLPLVSVQIPNHTSEATNLGFSYEIESTVHASIVTAAVRQLSPVDILTLRNSVLQDLQSSVDLAGFMTGAAFLVELVSARGDGGEWHVFDAFIPMLRRDGVVNIPNTLVSATGADIPAQMMLADFREAMRVPVQTGFFCYRAIEAAMQSFKSNGASDAEAWSRMRAALRIDRGAIERVKSHADWARHGRPGVVTDNDRVMLFETTRAIVQRYLDYVAAAGAPLGTGVALIR